jgi:hypothetical protein
VKHEEIFPIPEEVYGASKIEKHERTNIRNDADQEQDHNLGRFNMDLVDGLIDTAGNEVES